jgi:hypothetical protein
MVRYTFKATVVKLNALFTGLAILSGGWLQTTAAAAATLLSLKDAPDQWETQYALPFVATAPTTTISIAGYQPPSYAYATDNSVTLLGSDQNLLGPHWDFTPAALGSFATTFNDGSAVPGLDFGGLTAGDYDTYSQVLPTTPGETYVLSFLYSNSVPGGTSRNRPNGFLVTAVAGGVPGIWFTSSGASTFQGDVPEPSTWALALLGFGGLGLAGYRRARAKGVAPSHSSPRLG